MQVLSKNTHTIREETVHDGRENANTNFSGKAVFGLDRFLTRGEHASKYGVFSMGHVGVVVGAGDNDTPWIDEHAVRIRAGMLNVISWTALINVFFERDPTIALVTMIIAIWEFIGSSFFGLTPIAPIGTLATVVSMILYRDPLWTPARPKRFSWILGLIIVSTCLVLWRFAWANGLGQKNEEVRSHRLLTGEVIDNQDLSDYPIAESILPIIKGLVLTCLILTWLEMACGFCAGCFVYNRFQFISPQDAQKAVCDLCQIRVNGGHTSEKRP